jgi:hypothetical protein
LPSRRPTAVERFHSAALLAAGVDNGAPGVRTYGAGSYAAYVRDPDGNEAVVHGGHRRSGDTIEVETG